MKGQTLNLVLSVGVLFLIDLYVLNGLRGVSKKWKFFHKKQFPLLYWIYNAVLLAILFWAIYAKIDVKPRLVVVVFFFLDLLFKISFIPFLIIDDLRRVFIKIRRKKVKPGQQSLSPEMPVIPRSEFLIKAGLLAGAVPLAALKLSMKSGLYD